MSVKTIVTGAPLAAITTMASAHSSLSVRRSVRNEWRALAATEFETTAGISESMTLNGPGESFLPIATGSPNPNRPWAGRRGEPHRRTVELGR